MNSCRVCGNNLEEFINFGMMPIANSFKKSIQISEYKFPMSVGFCKNCMTVQLIHQPDPKKMFHENYAFFSSTSSYMKKHFYEFANKLIEDRNLNNKSFVVEIGCNDGILLENFLEKKIKSLGIEPSQNVAQIAKKKGINVINDFFNDNVIDKILTTFNKADVIVSANVICHIPDINIIFSCVKKLLADDGVFIFEDPYLLDIMNKNSFDQIYDEHVFFFSAMSISYIAKKNGLDLISLEPQKTHGGSMRYSIGHKNINKIDKSVSKQISLEKDRGLHLIKSYYDFEVNVMKIKLDLIKLLKKIKSDKKTVVGYAATSKSTTLINFFGISSDLLPVIFDTTPSKHNTYSPGANIPILPYSMFHKSDPAYVLLFAWNHSEEIMKKEANFMKENRKWILYVPEVKMI